jgi:hypothetical protein
MLSRRILFAAIVALVLIAPGRAQDRGFGLGVILGEPTGLSGKYWLSERNAVDAGMAWSFRAQGFFHIHADYLWHFPLHTQSAERFSFYAGVGGRLGAASHDALLGVRIVGGLVFWPRNTPIDVFLEFAPVLDLAPATEMTANGGIGVRFFFR